MTDTEDEFKAATEGGLDETDLAGLTEVIDDEEVVVDGIIDPLLPIDDEDPEEEEEDDLEKEIADYMYESKGYDE